MHPKMDFASFTNLMMKIGRLTNCHHHLIRKDKIKDIQLIHHVRERIEYLRPQHILSREIFLLPPLQLQTVVLLPLLRLATTVCLQCIVHRCISPMRRQAPCGVLFIKLYQG
uniref:Uncharacterized protein LOC105645596 isoform X2 n=1 Tax=Rhizophora mucronata TaxID=61149 RepID=A0A2P2J1A8_RHIMU